MIRATALQVLTVLLLTVLAACSQGQSDDDAGMTDSVDANKPNLVIFYTDDLGYGDVSSYGAVSVQTPGIDKLAANGVRFTDAHSTAAMFSR